MRRKLHLSKVIHLAKLHEEGERGKGKGERGKGKGEKYHE
jgi:hypothetical protein